MYLYSTYTVHKIQNRKISANKSVILTLCRLRGVSTNYIIFHKKIYRFVNYIYIINHDDCINVRTHLNYLAYNCF
jgi:hypothetical protein